MTEDQTPIENPVMVVKLSTGEDIVCRIPINQLISESTNYQVLEPMMYEVSMLGEHLVMALRYWLPVSILKHNRTHVSKSHIVCMTEATESFAKYYDKSLKNINEFESMSPEEKTNYIETRGNELQSRILETLDVTANTGATKH